jgi:hypothetical protein
MNEPRLKPATRFCVKGSTPCKKLWRMVGALARHKATTPDGFAKKALVIALSREALDADFWCGELQASLIALAGTRTG